MRRLAALAFVIALGPLGCKGSGSTPGGPAPSGAPPATGAAPSGTPPAAAPSAAAPTGQATADFVRNIEGKVLEKIDAPSYTYLRIGTSKGDVWAAVPTAKVNVGDTVTVAAQMEMQNFPSKTLNRTFEKLVFGTLADSGTANKRRDEPHLGPNGVAEGYKPPPPEAAPPHPSAPATDVGDVHVPKATGEGAHTVAEVWNDRNALAGKTVAVRGKVVKSMGGILGKNWLHLRDGSGSDGTNDLTVTTTDEAAVGDTVTARGKVGIDRDFGAGYTYPVIVEDAKIQK